MNGLNVLLLPDPLARLIEPVGADDAHGEEVVGRAKAARWKVALWNWAFGYQLCYIFFLSFIISWAIGGDQPTLYCTGS